MFITSFKELFAFRFKALTRPINLEYITLWNTNKTSKVLIEKFLLIDIWTLLGVLLVKFIKTRNYLDYAF